MKRKSRLKVPALIGASSVKFGEASALRVTYFSPNELKVVSPPGTGTVPVRVTTVDGVSPESPADLFKYVLEPKGRLGGLDLAGYCQRQGEADTGVWAGGKEWNVTLLDEEAEGENYAFGNWSCYPNHYESGPSFLPIAEAGPAPSFESACQEQYPGFDSYGYPEDPNNANSWICFAVQPKVEKVAPAAGPTLGNSEVVITGSGFKGAARVEFGSTPAASFKVESSTEIVATTPASASGPVNVTVTTAWGPSEVNANDVYVYDGTVPGVSKLTPVEGPEAGKTTVTIEGSGFTGATAVSFGATAATKYKVESASSISAEAPAGNGTAAVTVKTPGGTSAEVPADLYTYDPLPTVTALSIKEGPLEGGNQVTITGTGFTKASTVTFGATPAAGVSFESTTQLTATAPATLTAGPVNVEVTTAGGTSKAAVADEYTYVAVPVISAIEPKEGPVAGGTRVTITGTGLAGATAVRFADVETTYKVESPTSIVAVSPAGTPGPTSVTVETAGGISEESPADDFTYDPLPTVTALSVKEGPLAGGTKLTITGTGFTATSKVSFGGTPAKVATYVSETELSAESPAGTGTVNVTVETAGGTSTTSAADDFSYVATPTVTKLTPAEGPEAGKTTVTIEGSGFTGATAVSFGATAATKYKVESPTTISPKLRQAKAPLRSRSKPPAARAPKPRPTSSPTTPSPRSRSLTSKKAPWRAEPN